MKLHLTHDDKFIDAFIDQTQKLNFNNHHFYIYSSSIESPLRFVKSEGIKRIDIETLNNDDLKIEDYETVYIHYFSDELIDFVLKNGKLTTFVWVFWGADAFDLPIFNETFLAPETHKLYQKQCLLVGTGLKGIASRIKQKYSNFKHVKRKAKAARQFKYFAHYIHDDYLVIKQKIKLKARYIEFTYGSLETFAGNNTLAFSPKHILVGNSANPANNHIDALQQLAKTGIPQDSLIYCPLSYSGTEAYKLAICCYGEKHFNTHFKALTDFMPRDEYDGILSSIAYALMPHYRSQAFGNIINLLWQGTHLYFAANNNLYVFLKDKGFFISEISNNINFSSLTKLQITHNRNVLTTLLGNNAVKNYYTTILSL